MRLRLSIFGAACFVIGAATSGLFLSRAIAQGQPARPRFEYMCQDILRPWKADDLQKMNTLGAQGWELVLKSDVYCFKRQLP